jgi:hypothetical protein
MCDVGRRYTLAEMHAFISKNAPKIDSWLPPAVHNSIRDLERVVTESVQVAPRPHRGAHHHRHQQRGPVWQNKDWDNFRSFKATKVLSSTTPVSRFRTIFNKLTAGTAHAAVAELQEVMQEVGEDDEGNDAMAMVVLDGTAASPGNADLYASFILLCMSVGQGGGASALASRVMTKLRGICVKQASKASQPADGTYEALCTANAINDRITAYLRLAVLCERQGVLTAGSTAKLLQKLANRLASLGTVAKDKPEAEVLVARLVSAQEALGGPPSVEVRASMDTVLNNCEKRSEYPGLGNKVMFTLMDYYDTLE